MVMADNNSSIVTDSSIRLSPSFDFSAVILLIMSIVAIFGNLGTIVAYIVDPIVRRKASDLILLNLAFADLGVALFIMPRSALVKILGWWPFGELGCRVAYLLDSIFINAGVYFIVLLSWDRYQMLVNDYAKYLKKYNQIGYVLTAISLAWIIAALPGIAQNCVWNHVLTLVEQQPDYRRFCIRPSLLTRTGTIFNLVLIAVPIFLVAFLGILISVNLFSFFRSLNKVAETSSNSIFGGSRTNINPFIPITGVSNNTHGPRRQVRQVESSHHVGQLQLAHRPTASVSSTIRNQNSRHVIRKRYIKPIITCTALVLALLMCYPPLNVCIVVVNVYGIRAIPNAYLVMSCLNMLKLFNSAINPILYAVTYSRIRAFYRRKLNSMFRKCQARIR